MESFINAFDLSGLETFIAGKTTTSDGNSKDVIDLLQGQIERLLREKAMDLVAIDDNLENRIRPFVSFTVQVYDKGFCSKQTPVTCMSDMLDVSRIGKCDRLFTIVEENQDVFKRIDTVPVLRMCNDLLKRLSRTTDTSFCGRILFFLSRFLSLAEKSGLNLTGQFNTQNLTKYETKEEVIEAVEKLVEKEENEMETGEIVENADSTIPVDHLIYTKFWQMQDFFSNPNDCFNKERWELFNTNTTEVLSLFASYKLERLGDDDHSRRKRKGTDESAADLTMETMDDADTYFAKYLTSPKLLQLQFNDSQFRRSFLLQCLILFQYLTAEVKFKQKYVLTEEMLRFVIESQDRCYKLLRETHPKGSHFADSVKRILQRENEWSEWKNGGCADFTVLADKAPMNKYQKRPRVKFDCKEIDMGNSEMTKLWNIEPDILKACKDMKRKFTPSLRNFLQDPLDELDPEQQVDEEYKSIYDSGFQWRASRLLLAESQQFLMSGQLTGGVPKLLETAILKTANDIPELKAQLDAREAAARKRCEDAMRLKIEEEHSQVGSPCPDMSLSSSQIDTLSTLLSAQWKQLAGSMGLNEEQCEKLGKDQPESSEAVKTLLSQWTEENGESSRELLKFLLHEDLLNAEINSVLKNKIKTEAAA